MNFETIATNEVLLKVNRDELIILNNALNEICNGGLLAIEEFSTRMGATRQETNHILEQISSILDQM
ncbi:MAG TPA: hypothetical protein VMP08_25435 [Anaerolineae bacterium]|nr:hypothetical protein [Anaerolineae bacterium]